MILPVIILALSMLGIGLALILPGASDLLLLAIPCAVASLIWLLVSWRRAAATPKAWVIVDGSNVMHWKDNTARVETLREVLTALRAANFTPGVMFDANAGYKIAGRYMDDAALARAVGLPRDRILIVPRGEPADPMILTAARDFGARVVTNDRFRDYAERFPEVTKPATFLRGGYRDGKLWLDP